MTHSVLAKPIALIVEDDVVVRMMAADVFEGGGFIVLEASNATEALVILEKRGDVAVLFTNIDMPGGPTGLDLARQTHVTHPRIALLIASWYLPPAAGDMPKGAEYFSKPYDPAHIVARAHQMIAKVQSLH